MIFKFDYCIMILRPKALNLIESAFHVHPIAALFGPRKCDKIILGTPFYFKVYFLSGI